MDKVQLKKSIQLNYRIASDRYKIAWVMAGFSPFCDFIPLLGSLMGVVLFMIGIVQCSKATDEIHVKSVFGESAPMFMSLPVREKETVISKAIASTCGNYIFLLLWAGCFLISTVMPEIFMVNSAFYSIFSEILSGSPLLRVIGIELILMLFVLMAGGSKYTYRKGKEMRESTVGSVIRYLPLVFCLLVFLDSHEIIQLREVMAETTSEIILVAAVSAILVWQIIEQVISLKNAVSYLTKNYEYNYPE